MLIRCKCIIPSGAQLYPNTFYSGQFQLARVVIPLSLLLFVLYLSTLLLKFKAKTEITKTLGGKWEMKMALHSNDSLFSAQRSLFWSLVTEQD